MGRTATRISILIFCPLAILFLIGTFSSSKVVQSEFSVYPDRVIESGEPVPTFEFEDIRGERGASGEYNGGIVVYTFADWRSYGDMVEVLEKAGLRIMQEYPRLKVDYIGIPDLHAVPRVLRGLVKPVLKAIVNRAVRDTQKTYRKMNLPFSEITTSFSIVPDWTGEYMKIFGLETARDFHCFVTEHKRVIGVVSASTPDAVRAFTAIFDNMKLARVESGRI